MLSVGPTPAQVIEYGNLIAQQQATQVVAQVQQRAEQVVLQHQSHVEASAREYVSSIEQQASASVAQRRQEIESQAVDFRHAVEQQAHAMHQTSLEQLAIMQRRLEQLEIENQQLRSQVFALNRADNGTGPELIPHNTIGQGGEHRNFMDPHVRAELDVVRGDMQQLIAAVRELSGRGFNHPAPLIASSRFPEMWRAALRPTLRCVVHLSLAHHLSPRQCRSVIRSGGAMTTVTTAMKKPMALLQGLRRFVVMGFGLG